MLCLDILPILSRLNDSRLNQEEQSWNLNQYEILFWHDSGENTVSKLKFVAILVQQYG
jgi:hypothetical protein